MGVSNTWDAIRTNFMINVAEKIKLTRTIAKIVLYD